MSEPVMDTTLSGNAKTCGGCVAWIAVILLGLFLWGLLHAA